MKKMISFSIGIIFTAVVLCFTATPLIMAAEAGDGSMSGCAQAGNNQEQPNPACGHQTNSDAHFQAPIQISANSSIVFQPAFIRSVFEEYLTLEDNKFSVLLATAPPGNYNHDQLTFSKTVVLRF